MPSYVFAYTRRTLAGQAKGDSTVEAQNQALEALYRGKLASLGLAWAGLFVDPASSRKRRFVDREAGGELNRRLHRGDHVLLTSPVLAFPHWADFLLMAGIWEERGIAFHILDPEIDSHTETGQIVIRLLASFAGMERQRRGRTNP